MSTDPYGGADCSGDNQGGTNINCGTTDCINVSDADSLYIYGDISSHSIFEYFAGTDCTGSSVGGRVWPGVDLCFDKPDRVASIMVDPNYQTFLCRTVYG